MNFFGHGGFLAGTFKGRFSLVTIVGIFLSVSLVGVPYGSKKFISPDETANYWSARQFSSGQGLTIPSQMSVPGGLVAPRSFIPDQGRLVPASFFGISIVLGTIARLVGAWSIPFVTPVLSTLAILAFYSLVSKFTRRNVALLSAVLLAIHPAFLYYTSRGLFHNVMFLDLAIFGFWGLTTVLTNSNQVSTVRKMAWFALAGLMLGLAIAVRTSEVVWVGIFTFVLLISFRRRLQWFNDVLVFLVTALVPMLLIMHYNQQYYGHGLSFGYSGDAVSTTSVNSFTASLMQKVAILFFPFGLDVKLMALNAWQYGLQIFWLPSLFSLLGLWLVLRSRKFPVSKLYLVLFAFLSLWLLAYYGSWRISDNPNADVISIGTSYTRYWLPAYVMALPLAASFIFYLIDRAGRLRRIVLVGLIAAMSFNSILLVVLDKHEGLVAIRKSAIEYRQLADKAVKSTPPGSVIISGFNDKVFFPERSVIVDAGSAARQLALRELLDHVPVYVYVPAAQSTASAEETWQQMGFELYGQIDLTRNERLLQLRDLRKSPSQT